jgi:hypothetical protein
MDPSEHVRIEAISYRDPSQQTRTALSHYELDAVCNTFAQTKGNEIKLHITTTEYVKQIVVSLLHKDDIVSTRLQNGYTLTEKSFLWW